MFCDLSDKSILVTGASSGIGEATAKIVADRGGIPYLFGRSTERLQKVKEDILRSGGKVGGVFACDLTNQQDRDTAVVDLVDAQFHGVVFSAGMSKPTPIQLITEAYIDEVFAINAKSVFLMLSSLVKRRKLVNASSVVLLSSIAASTGTKGTFAYSASKGALQGALKALTDEFSKKLIRINSVAPAVVRTNIWTAEQETYLQEQELIYPLGLAKSDDIAAIIAFLLSEQSKLIVGQNLVIDSGCTNIR
jgi:NAD(P)-dependent dehydrogenase (short-subunit alcohol dehydrogenase family)